MQAKYNLPSLGGANSLTKQAIFGLNSSRIYDLTLDTATNLPDMPTFSEDRLAQLATDYRESGEGPSNKRYGYVRTV
jgi:hypothetical protein